MLENDLTTKLATITGPDGIDAFENDIEKLEQSLKQQITTVQGQLQAITIVKRLLIAHKKAWGLLPPDAEKQQTVKIDITQPDETILHKEIQERIANKQCIYRTKDKKWCSRILKTKAEQRSGYCATHMRELGIKSEPVTKKGGKK